MFVFWGTKHKTKDAGVVADRCDACGELAAFTVIDHYEAGHVYYVSLTQGTHRGTSKTCENCGAESRCAKSRYDRLLPAADAVPLSVREVLERTNRKLLATIERREEIERKVAEGGASPSAQDTRRDLAIEKLEEEGEFEGSEQLAAKLQLWERLDATARTRLLDKVDHAIAENRQIRQGVSFLRAVAGSFSDSAGCIVAATLFGILVAGPLIAFPATRGWWGVAGLAVFALVVATVLYLKLSGMIVRNWTRKTFVPQAAERGLDFDLLVSLLAGVDTDDEDVDDKIREVAREVGVIAAVLLEDGRIVLPADEAGPEEKGIFDGEG